MREANARHRTRGVGCTLRRQFVIHAHPRPHGTPFFSANNRHATFTRVRCPALGYGCKVLDLGRDFSATKFGRASRLPRERNILVVVLSFILFFSIIFLSL